jgi:hypothetical protein
MYAMVRDSIKNKKLEQINSTKFNDILENLKNVIEIKTPKEDDMFWTGLIYNKSCKIKNLVFISIQQN